MDSWQTTKNDVVIGQTKQANEHTVCNNMNMDNIHVTTVLSCFHGKTIRKTNNVVNGMLADNKMCSGLVPATQNDDAAHHTEGCRTINYLHFRMTTFTCKLALAKIAASLHSPSFKEGLTKEIAWAQLPGRQQVHTLTTLV